MSVPQVNLSDCLAGQPVAWQAFVHRYGRLIHTAVHRVLTERVREDIDQLCEDVVQDVFVRLVARQFTLLRSFDPSQASLATWLTIVARSVAIDHLRKRRLRTQPLDELIEQIPAQISEPETDHHEPTAQLPPGLLSPRQTLVMHLLYDRQMEVAEIAKLLAVDEQTVRSTRHKALEKLRLYYGVSD